MSVSTMSVFPMLMSTMGEERKGGVRLRGFGGKKKMELKNVTMETDGRTNK